MRNETWSEMDRTCTKKLSEELFLDKIVDRNYQNCESQSGGLLTVDFVKKWSELRTAIIRAGSANLCFKSDFSQGSKEDWTLSSQTSFNTLKK
jgi:hypothetical protein